MKITIVQVGKTRFEYLREGIEDYHRRIRHYAGFEEISLPDIKNARALSQQELSRKEGELILKAIGKSTYTVLLDERGKEMTSVKFADFISRNMISGRDIAFVIGGAYGFSGEVYERADEKISLSEMTFSHQLVRLIFAEQLYRAMTIIKGEPYHHN